MIPSCFPWKVVIFFGKEHVNWSSISGVMIGLSWEIKFGKINYLFGYTNFEFSKLDFSTSSYHNSTNTGPIDMFFTKKYNYFSCETRWNHPILSQSPLKGYFGTIKKSSQVWLPVLYVKYFVEFIWIQWKLFWCWWSHSLLWVVKVILFGMTKELMS